jgi:hypothetical protein
MPQLAFAKLLNGDALSLKRANFLFWHFVVEAFWSYRKITKGLDELQKPNSNLNIV